MKVLFNDEISFQKWNSLININSYSTPFQSSKFYKLFNSVSRFSALAVAVEIADQIEALVVVTIQKESGIKGYISKRAIIYGGPLIENDNLEALELLLNEINKKLKGKVIYSETRNLHDYKKFKESFKKYGWNYRPYLNFHLNCKTRDNAWNQLNTNRKRQIKKALKKGIIIKTADSLHEVEIFFSLLKDLYTNKIKKPLLPFDFFKAFYQLNIGKYLLVYYNDKIIGGIMCPILPNKTIFEFYICGLDQKYKEASPSVMATYAAIEYGYKNRLNRFDFMGAGKPNESYGVREFKEKFGGELVEHGRFLKIYNPVLYKIGTTALLLLKKFN